jgi:hypothetical protein
MKKIIAKLAVTAVAVLMAANAHAQLPTGQTINMGLIWNFPNAATGFTASFDGAPAIVQDDLIGIYSFNINSVTPDTVTFTSPVLYTMCISPIGNLNFGNFNYTLQTFQQASPGLFPSQWKVGPNGQGWGIQNAYYLFNLLAPTLDTGHLIAGEAGNGADQGAAMALAVYTALYNSSGFGAAANGANSPTGGWYIPSTGFGNIAVYQDYTNDLHDLTHYTGNSVSPGYVLTPFSSEWYSGGGQAMLVIDQNVPEPATVISGLLLLLPTGASMFRILRKNRAV